MATLAWRMTVLVLALCCIPLASARVLAPSALTVTSNSPQEATSPSGASVTYSVTSSDAAVQITCSDGASGTGSASRTATYGVGSHNVNCSGSDGSAVSVPIEVTDKTAPTLSLPSDQTLSAPTYVGVPYSYSATATDVVDGSVAVSCDHASGSTFPPGPTTVTCNASDSRGNKATGSFTVTVNVVDNPPALSPTADITREANSPQGSVVTYAAPTAVDDIDGPIALVTCAPASGTRFPLGTTVVTCQAADAHGHTGSSTFSIHVVDTTPPVLIVPGDRTVHATSAAGYASTYFTRLASATDIADPHPRITSDAPDIVPVGTTKVTFAAFDASGNHASGSSLLTVLPVESTAQVTPPPDRQPPDDVTAVNAKAGDSFITLTWKLPRAPDFASVVITRAATDGASQVVYRGNDTTYTDRGVINGVEYRYLIVAMDKAGNRSTGVAVVATPKRAMLRSPRDGASLRKPPLLRWLPVKNASYYNVQMFRENTRILSAWPKRTTLRLHRSWKFGPHRYRLTPGLYRWYVWPGFGSRAGAEYGDLLGSSTFRIVR